MYLYVKALHFLNNTTGNMIILCGNLQLKLFKKQSFCLFGPL